MGEFFRQMEETHTTENIIFNELKIREVSVYIRVISKNKKNIFEGNNYEVKLPE